MLKFINNENLIYHILKKYNLSVDEYYDVGVIGLCKAAISYNSNFGFTFSTYACKCIENGVKLEFRNQSKRIHPDMLIYIDEVDEENNTYLQIPCPKTDVEKFRISRKYGLTNPVFRLIICRLNEQLMMTAPLILRQTRHYNQEILYKEGG